VIAFANFSKPGLQAESASRHEEKKTCAVKRSAVSGSAAPCIYPVSLLALQKLAIDPNQAKITFSPSAGTDMTWPSSAESGSATSTALDFLGRAFARTRAIRSLVNFKGCG
jgi:hypothetical protein